MICIALILCGGGVDRGKMGSVEEIYARIVDAITAMELRSVN